MVIHVTSFECPQVVTSDVKDENLQKALKNKGINISQLDLR